MIHPFICESLIRFLIFLKQGIAMYAFLNIAGFALLVITVMLYLIYYLITCCCSCSSARPIKSPPRWRFVISYGCMTFSMLFICVVAILGHTLGGSQLTEGITHTSDSAKGISTIVQSSVYPAQQVIVNSFSKAVVPALSSLNKTVFDAIDLGSICNDTHVVHNLYLDLGIITYVRETFDDLSMRGTAVIDQAEDEILGIENQLDLLEVEASQMLSHLKHSKKSLSNMTELLTESLPLIEEFDEISRELLGPSSETGPTGIVGSTLADISTIRYDETTPGGFGFPLASTYADAASGSLASVESLQPDAPNSLNGEPSSIGILNDKLDFIYNRMLMLPDYGVLGDKIVSINETLNIINKEGGLVDKLNKNFELLTYYQSRMPDVDIIKSDLDDFFDAAYGLSFVDLRAAIVEVGQFIKDIIEPFETIRDKLDKLDIESLLGPLSNLMVRQANVVSSELYDLDGIYDSTEHYAPLERKISDSIDTVADVVQSLDDAIEDIGQINVTEYLKTIDDIVRSINETLNQVDQAELHRLLSTFGDAVNGVNATHYLSELGLLEMKFNNIFIPFASDILPILNLLEQEKVAAVNALKRAVGTDNIISSVAGPRDGDYRLLAKGVCSLDTDIYCDNAAECPGGSCQSLGVYRCAGNGLNTPVTACSADSACGPNSYCLNDIVRTATLRVRLEVFASGMLIGDAESSVGDIGGLSDLEINSVFNASEYSRIVSDAISDLNEINLDTYIDQAEDIIADIRSHSLSDVTEAIEEAKDAYTSFDFAEYNKTLADIEDVKDDLSEYFPDVVITCENLYDFIFDKDGLRSHFEYFSEENLLQLVDDSGPGGMLRSAMKRIDLVGEIFRDMFINFTTLDRTNVAVHAEIYATSFNEVAGHGPYRDIYNHGSLYFLTQLYNQTKKRTINARDPIAHAVLEGSDGQKYNQEDKKKMCLGDSCFQMCLTRKCFAESKNDLDEEPIIEASGIDTSFEALVGYVWIGPFIVVLFGVISMLCPLMTANPCLRKAPATCMIGCSICLLGPFLLLTGLFFPFVIFAADGCNASEGIVQGLMNAYGDDICKDLDGTGGLRSCTMETYNFSVTVNPYSMVSGVLGDCSDDAVGEPYAGPLYQIAAQLRSKARDQAERKLHGEYYDDLEIYRLNKTLEDIGLDAIEDISGVVASFLEDSGDNVLSCAKVSGIKDSLIYPVCTSTIGALGWYLGCLYLMAWSLCCLAVPAGCCVQYDNEQRAKELAAYQQAFGDELSEVNDGEFEPADDDHEEDSDEGDNGTDYGKHRAIATEELDDGESSGAFGAVFGRRRASNNEDHPSAPPASALVEDTYFVSDDNIEL